MADCSKTLEYAKELDRMCKYYLNTDSKCDKCPLKEGLDCNEITSITQKHITGVQTWSDYHPVKTRQSEFLKMFTNATTNDGILTIKPCHLDCVKYGLCKSHNCDDCRREYWMEEIE